MGRKVFCWIITLVIGCWAWGQQSTPLSRQAPINHTSGVRGDTFTVRAQAMSNMLVRTGGLLEVPSSRLDGKRICIINAQKDLNDEIIINTKKEIEKILRYRIDVVRDEQIASPMEGVAQALKDRKNAAVLLICMKADYPMILVAPDSHWVILNVYNMKSGKADNGLFGKRISKQIWRSLGFLLGAPVGVGEKCLMSPVDSIEELDKLDAEAISPVPMQKMMRNAEYLGVMQTKITTYRKACEEGWAPMPTNSYQKAIWDEVKAGKK